MQGNLKAFIGAEAETAFKKNGRAKSITSANEGHLKPCGVPEAYEIGSGYPPRVLLFMA